MHKRTAQETFKRYMNRETMGVMQPKIWLRFPGTCDIRYFRNKLFLTSRGPFLITCTTKSYLHSEAYTAYHFYTLYPKNSFFYKPRVPEQENIHSGTFVTLTVSQSVV